MLANLDGTSAESQPNKNTEDINSRKISKHIKKRKIRTNRTKAEKIMD